VPEEDANASHSWRWCFGDGNAEFGWAMTLMGIVGIWYASNGRAHPHDCEDIEAGFHEKARGAPTVQ
jgi:hypothetical protein